MFKRNNKLLIICLLKTKQVKKSKSVSFIFGGGARVENRKCTNKIVQKKDQNSAKATKRKKEDKTVVTGKIEFWMKIKQPPEEIYKNR